MEGIFQTMSYNEAEKGNFSKILNWLDGKGNTITSLVGGKDFHSFSHTWKFQPFVGRSVDVRPLNGVKAGDHLGSYYNLPPKEEEGNNEPLSSSSEEESSERWKKFENLLLDKNSGVLEQVGSLLEGGTTPLWQLREYDIPEWNNFVKGLIKDPSFLQARRMLEKEKVVHVSLNGESLAVRDLLVAISLGILFEGKFVLSITSCFPPFSVSSSLEGVMVGSSYLVDLVNKIITATPIDLLIVDEGEDGSFLQTIATSPQSSSSSSPPILVLQDDFSTRESIPTTSSWRILGGVLGPERLPRSLHFLVDCSADVNTAVDSITEEIWASGSKVPRYARTLIFAHQPVYKEVVDLLEKKTGGLKPSVDFIERRGNVPSSFLKKELEGLGVRIFPSSPTSPPFVGPTVVSELGSCVDPVAQKVGGMSHIVCVLPYRSSGEVVSLANNHGNLVETRIYSQDLPLIKKLVGAVKGTEVRVNSNGLVKRKALVTPTGGPFDGSFQWIFMKKSRSLLTKKDGFPPTQQQLEGEHLLPNVSKSWPLLSPFERFQVLEKVGESLGHPTWFGKLGRIQVEVGQGSGSGGGLVNYGDIEILSSKGIGGVVAIVISKGINNPGSVMMGILTPILLGNVVVILGKIHPTHLEKINKALPPGVLTHLSKDPGGIETLMGGKHKEKVGLICLLQGGQGDDSDFGLTSIPPSGTALVSLSIPATNDDDDYYEGLRGYARSLLTHKLVAL